MLRALIGTRRTAPARGRTPLHNCGKLGVAREAGEELRQRLADGVHYPAQYPSPSCDVVCMEAICVRPSRRVQARPLFMAAVRS